MSNVLKHVTRYFLGALTTQRPDWQNFCAAPTSNLKTEKGRADANEAAAERQNNDSYTDPYHAYVTELTVLDSAGNGLFQSWMREGDAPGVVSARFLEFLNSSPELAMELIEGSSFRDCRVKWFGINIRRVLRVVAADVMFLNVRAPADQQLPVPIGLYYHRTFEPAPTLDPYDVLVEAARQKDVTFPYLNSFLNVPSPGVLNSATLAAVARELAFSGHFFPVG